MTSKFSIDNRELLQRISSGEAIVGIDFGNLIVRELAAFRLAAMDQKPALHRYRRKAVEPYGPYPWHYEVFVDYPRPVECIEDEYFYAVPPVVTGFAVDGEPAENHIGSKNALDAIVSFIKSKSNPTVKCYEEVSEQLFKDNCHGIHSHVIEYILKLGEELEDLRAEQAEMQPAPVVPDDVLDALQKVARIRLDMNDFDGDRRGIADCLCDAEEALIEVVNRRAAMFNHPEQHLDMVDHSGDVNEKGGDGNSPVIPDGWTCNDKANAALMMLDRIETVDPVDDDRIDGIKRIVRELAAAPHDTPALNSVQSVDSVADRWIPVSERMPPSRHEVLVGRWWGEKPRWCCKWATYIPGHPDSQSSGWLIPGASWTPTHWMPLPAAPQEPSLACISKRSQHLS